ncbi:hypothetical protein SASPL_104391 [Salvia splendens]|uniref:Uncharacterized protein n=1 Tax=Salvia splendens TaxID=180675 RepID=A0A8X8YJU4_SALSN|nr:hypothetical protein SASPL_104391 [Salvia splendens]
MSGTEPNAYAFVSILTACMRLVDLDLGSQIHALSIKTGHVNCSFVANAAMGKVVASILWSNCSMKCVSETLLLGIL